MDEPELVDSNRERLVRALLQGATSSALSALVPRLLREFDEWESVRARLTAARGPRRATVERKKSLVFFDGVPGAGKTTHIGRLQETLGAEHLSMAEFARTRNIAQGDRRAAQRQGTLHPTDEAFLAEIDGSLSPTVVLEKFPRTPIEAQALVDWADARGFALEAVFLEFPDDPVPSSVRRQLERGARRGKEVTAEFAAERAMKNLARSASARSMLRSLGVPIVRLDSTDDQVHNEARLRERLGAFRPLRGVEVQPLRLLDQVASRLGLEAWVSGGHAYRPFWNGTFGPLQRPHDVDVAVDEDASAEALRVALEQEEPRLRWSVIAPSEVLRRDLGVVTRGVLEAKAQSRLLHRGTLVRWHEGRLEHHFPPGAEASLRSGLVRVNRGLLEQLDERWRRKVLDDCAHKLPRTLSDYPGLGIDEATSALLAGRIPARRPTVVGGDFRTLKLRTLADAGPRPAEPHRRRRLSPAALTQATQLLRFHQLQSQAPQAPPVPARASLPPVLETLRQEEEHTLAGRAKTPEERRTSPKRTLAPPEGFGSWLHVVAARCDDASFREWLLDQVHHHRPTGGADPFLRSLLSFELFAPTLKTLERSQSALHEGWTLERHLAESALQLETDEVASTFGATLPQDDARLCLRMAMLFHDVGKLAGPKATRPHALIGSRLFLRHRPAWFPEPLVGWVRWMVEVHDLFGCLARSLTDKEGATPGDFEVEVGWPSSYWGAIDVDAAVRRLGATGLPLSGALRLAKALWRADVGSIAALRWLQPIADDVEGLVQRHVGSTHGVGRREGIREGR